MAMTRVVRGDDLLRSTPRQLALYRALGAARARVRARAAGADPVGRAAGQADASRGRRRPARARRRAGGRRRRAGGVGGAVAPAGATRPPTLVAGFSLARDRPPAAGRLVSRLVEGQRTAREAASISAITAAGRVEDRRLPGGDVGGDLRRGSSAGSSSSSRTSSRPPGIASTSTVRSRHSIGARRDAGLVADVEVIPEGLVRPRSSQW